MILETTAVVFFYSFCPAQPGGLHSRRRSMPVSEGSVIVMQRKLRLRSRSDFSRVYKTGRSFANSQFVVYWSRNSGTECFRAGVSVSRKLGGAVVRNRMRRVVKELIRLNQEKIADRTDFIIIVRRPALEMKTQALERSLLHVLRKAGLLKDRKPVHKARGQVVRTGAGEAAAGPRTQQRERGRKRD